MIENPTVTPNITKPKIKILSEPKASVIFDIAKVMAEPGRGWIKKPETTLSLPVQTTRTYIAGIAYNKDQLLTREHEKHQGATAGLYIYNLIEAETDTDLKQINAQIKFIYLRLDISKHNLDQTLSTAKKLCIKYQGWGKVCVLGLHLIEHQDDMAWAQIVYFHVNKMIVDRLFVEGIFVEVGLLDLGEHNALKNLILLKRTLSPLMLKVAIRVDKQWKDKIVLGMSLVPKQKNIWGFQFSCEGEVSQTQIQKLVFQAIGIQ